MNVAVVGSRNATSYGISTTRRLSMDLAGQQVTIVSGMARGVDTAAHSGAIAGGEMGNMEDMGDSEDGDSMDSDSMGEDSMTTEDG